MTRDAETRSSLSAWRMTFTFILGTVLGFSVLRIINALGGDAMAYTKTALLFSIIAIPMFLICVAGTREIVEIPYEKHSVMSQFKLLKGNTPVWLLTVAFVAWGFMNGGATFKMYYFTYFVGDQILFANVNTITPIFAAVGTFSLNWMVTKVKNKATIPAWGFAICALASFICFFLPMKNIGADGGTTAKMLYYVLGGAIPGFCTGIILGSLYGMVPDTAEWTMYKYNQYAGGFLSTVVNFFFKLGQAFSIAAAAWVLEGIGYVPNAVQTDSVMWHLNFWPHIYCGACYAIAAIAMFAYKLDKATYAKIAAEVSARRDAASGKN